MNTERWARVPDSPYGVEVSDRGRVRRHGVILPPSPARRPAVNIGPQRPRAIQYLVLEAFVGPRPKGYVCCHRNDDSRDNRLANLYWGTYMREYEAARLPLKRDQERARRRAAA